VDEFGVLQDQVTFPDFLSMDYYYFKELDSRERPAVYGLDSSHRKHMIVAKSRRKGFSFKAAAGAV